MNLNFAGNTLFGSFNLVAGVIPSSAIKRVLQGVKVSVCGGKVELTATDLEVLVKCQVPVRSCEGEGSVILPAVRVNNIFREWASNEEVLIVIEGTNCVIKSKGGHFKIVGEESEQFPQIPTSDIMDFFEVDGEIMGNMAEKVSHAVSKIPAKANLSGIFMRVDRDSVVMVAADGNRLSFVRRRVNNPGEVAMEGIVNVKCFMFLQRFVSECKGTLKVKMGESRICFAGERGEVVSQLIDGRYPRYEEIIPKESSIKVEVKREDLLSVVKMASFMTIEGYRVVKFMFRKGKLILTSKAADIGESELAIDANYDGEGFEISFSPDYVIDALKVSEYDVITIEFKDSESAAVFRTGHDQLDVIMPVELR